MRINPFVYAILVLSVFLGVIYASQSAGLWSTSGKQDSQGRAVQPNSADVSTIKGWMTLEQISAAYNVSLEEIIQAFNLPADTPASTAVKDLESDTFSVSGLRDWLASRSSGPSVQPTATPLPTVAPTPTPSGGGSRGRRTQRGRVQGQWSDHLSGFAGLGIDARDHRDGHRNRDARPLVAPAGLSQWHRCKILRGQGQAAG